MTAVAVPRETEDLGAQVTMPLELLQIGPNVRMDPGDLEELAASIREFGVLQPVKVQSTPAGWIVLWGQRRVLASRLAGLERIPVIIASTSFDSTGLALEQLVENLQRADLNPLEEATALRAILDADPKLTHDALADKLGRSRPWVSNVLGLLDVAPKVQEAIRTGELTASHAKALRGLAPTTQVELASQAIARGQSSRGLEESVQRHKDTEEWRKQRETQERESAKKKEAGWAASIAKLEQKKVPKDTEIRVTSYYGSSPVGHVATLLKKAGYTNVVTKEGITSPRPTAVGCDCTAWKVEPQYERLIVTPGCIVQAHQRAKTDADEKKRHDGYDLQKRVQARLEEVAPTYASASPFAKNGGAGTTRTIHLDPLLARMALWHALSYRAADWAEARGGKRGDPWTVIAGLEEVDLATELAKAIAGSFRDNYGYHIPWAGIAPLVAVDLPAPPPAKPAKAKKEKV